MPLVADPGEGKAPPPTPPQLPPLFLDLKKFFGLPLSKGLDDRVPPPPLSQGLDLALATTCTQNWVESSDTSSV